MIRFGSQSVVLPFQRSPPRLICKRHFSYFLKRARNREQPCLSVIQSNMFCGAGKQSVTGRVKILTAVERCITSKTKKSEVSEVHENKEQALYGNAETTFESSDERVIKNLIETSILKEDNLDLFWKISQGDPKIFNILRSWQTKLNILSKIYNVEPRMDEEKWMTFLKNSKALNERYISYMMIVAVKQQKTRQLFASYKPPAIEVDHDSDTGLYDDPMCYHLFHNSLFLNFRPKAFKRLMYSRAMTSVLYGPEVFIDCSYDEYMDHVEAKYFSKQVIDGMKKNFMSKQPFHVILCNFNKNSAAGKQMSKYSPLFYEEYYPITHTPKSYLDFYPREKFVYLTPHCTNIMTEFDPHKKYIIGGFVDRRQSQPISLAKAKQNKIEMAKFPLDKYLEWQKGKKSLCVNHVLEILLSLKDYNNDWQRAFEVIPKRNFVKPEHSHKKKKSAVLETVRNIFSLEN